MKTLLLLCLLFTFRTYGKPQAQIVEIKVTEKGFEPATINVKSDAPVQLQITRITDVGCTYKVQIPSRKIMKDLPLNKTVKIDLKNLKKGEMQFGCEMDMMESGKLVID